MNIGFVGNGWITGLHMKSFEKIEGVKVAAFCNPHLEKAEAAAAKCGAHAYSDCKTMLDTEKLDAVYVCVPPFAHNGQELLIAERGIPMFVEKPLTLSLEYAEQVNRLISEKQLVTSVGYVFKYLEMFDKVRDVLKGHHVVMVRGCWANTMPPVYWWHKHDTCGSQIIEQTTHVFDLFRALFGEVATIQGISNCGAIRDRSVYDMEDSSSVNLLFCNGIVGNLVSAAYAPPQSDYFHIEILCSDNLLCRMSLFDGKLEISDANGRQEIQCSGQDVAFVRENKIFFEAIRTGDQSHIRSTYADALKTHKLTLAAMDSLKNGGCSISL